MKVLDRVQHILHLDESQMHQAIKDLPLQLAQAWEESSAIIIPDQYKEVKNIIICGMGGSALGPHIVMGLYEGQITRPVEIVSSYVLPGYANEQTLVILSSNSGNTEEILACEQQAEAHNCKILVITAGGTLQTLSEQKHYPGYLFDQKYNRTGQPRMSTGYMIMSVIAFLIHLEFLQVDTDAIMQAIHDMNTANRLNGLEIETRQNPAKQIAESIITTVPFLIGAEFLSGVVHTVANQINENAKKLSAYFLISEMNHHLLEGLAYEQNKDAVKFLLFSSTLYSKRIQQRMELTRTIIERNNFKVLSIPTIGQTAFAQTCNALQLGSYISYYLAILNEINPTPIPWVDFLKKELDELS